MPANTQPMIQAEDMAQATTTVEMINWLYKVENWWMRRQKCFSRNPKISKKTAGDQRSPSQKSESIPDLCGLSMPKKSLKNLWKTWEKDGKHAGNLWVFHPFPNFWIPGLRPRNCSTLQPAKRPSSRSSRPGAAERSRRRGGHERWTVQDRKLGFKHI